MVDAPPTGPQGLLNAMTVDVEEHFQVSGFERSVRRETWDSLPSRVEANTERMLDVFESAGVLATFFVLGWVAERHADLVRRIAVRGHEIGCHGYSHRLVYEQEPQEFRDEVELSRRILQDASGQAVDGYRAASFSIGRHNLWALDVLVEAGFVYDSSLFPVYHDRYGYPGAPRGVHRLRTPLGQSLVEVPPSTLSLGRATLPVAGGGYLRLYPKAFSRWVIRRLNRHEGMPAVVYVHPWELDQDQPRLPAGLFSRMRHYRGLDTTESKLRDLMRHFRFGPVREVIEQAARGEARLTDGALARSLS